ncbi:TPA: hypothetical protein ACH3X1_013668 [Trebouxia sp. C0004]
MSENLHITVSEHLQCTWLLSQQYTDCLQSFCLYPGIANDRKMGRSYHSFFTPALPEELKSFRIRFQRTHHWWQTPKPDAPWSEREVPLVNGCIHIPCLLDDLGCSLWFSGLLFVGNLAITVVPLQQYSQQLDVDSLPGHPVEVTFKGLI